MIGLVLVTHGRLAEEFVAAAEHVLGPQTQMEAVCIGADDDMEQRRQDIAEAILRAENGDGVVLLTDIYGSTPSNLALSLQASGRVEVIAGLNLPMLIKLATVRRQSDLPSAIDGALASARKYINVATRPVRLQQAS